MKMETILYMFCSVADIRNKWSTLRAQFFRELRGKKGKSGSGAIMKTSKWKFFKQMSFVQLPAEREQRCKAVYTGWCNNVLSVICIYLFVYVCHFRFVLSAGA